MTPERWKKVEEMFESALRLAPDERRTFLRDACGTDEQLRGQVETLIASYESASSYANRSPLSAQTIIEESVDEFIGRRIGAYKTVREIGRGGMGSVFLAVRADDEFQKRVAIKLIKRGMDTDFIVRRFRNERQILASLDHPYIARLLDGGTTEDGLPYFVMEYVEGQQIHHYCDTQKLSVAERLKLFRKVCAAVTYAHQNLIIHRDLKPSNILVTHDGTPKLLDFGIAKILNPEIASPTLDPTTATLRLMTPEYASPEQVRGERATVASDVYTLGVMLYELLTDHRPYRLRSRLPEEIAHIICDEEPESPSLAINQIEVIPVDGEEPIEITPDSVARARNTSIEHLRRELSGSLDNIVMKALRKEPQRRYQAAEELSDDIKRYLEGQPVLAPSYFPTATEVSTDETPTASRSIAVLPFKVLRVEEKSDEFLGMGLADAIITKLSQTARITVKPTSAVLKYYDGEHSAQAAGYELKVGYVLDGRIQRVGQRVRVTVQLVRVRDGAPLWATKFDENFTDIFTVEDSISEQVAEALAPGGDSKSLLVEDEESAASLKERGVEEETAHASATGAVTRLRTAEPLSNSTGFLSTFSERSARKSWALVAAVLGVGLIAAILLYAYVFRSSNASHFQQTRSLKLTTSGNIVTAALSPDGKYVAYAMDEAGKQGLWVRQVAVANSVRLVAPADLNYRGLTFSRDGTFIFYSAADRNDQSKVALYQVPALGGSVKKLIDGLGSPVSFSPDGKRMAFVRADAERGLESLVLTNADGMNEQTVASRKFPEHIYGTGAPCFSPDGARVAFVVVNTDANGVFMKVAEVGVDGRNERLVSPDRWQDINQVAWLHDGSGLLIAAQDQSSSYLQLWRLDYPSGQARRVINDLSDYRTVSLSANAGELLTVQRQTFTSIWVAARGNTNQLAQVTSGAGRYFDLRWTPEGKILYASEANGSADIWEMDADGSNQRQLTAGAGRNYGPSVSPDGRYIVFHSSRTGTWQIWRMNRDGGMPVQLTNGQQESNWAQVSPDGRWVVYEHAGQGSIKTLWKIPVEGGEAVRLTEKFSLRPAISPDGKWIACWQREDQPAAPWKIAIVPFDGGEAVKLFDVPQSDADGNSNIFWTQDGRGVVYTDYRDNLTNLKLQPIDGGAPQAYTNFAKDLFYSYALSRDGQLVFARSLTTNDVLLITDTARSSGE